jgi:NADH-ubiquinone oxidoreductase chain 2
LIYYNFILIASTIILKRGTAPFHFWFPSVIEGLSWISNFILITWQKLAPLIILSYCIRLNLLIFIIFFSITFGRLGGINQTSLRKLIAFSSINHLGWIISGIIRNENIWINYFLFYSFLNFSIVFILNNFKLYNINQTFKIFNFNKFITVSLFIIFLSLGGLPPFLGFFPKWLIIELLIKNNMFTILVFILFITLITLYFYLRLTYSALLLNHINIKWNFKMYSSIKNLKILLMINFISLIGLILINFIYIFL